jgi:hypothetical protein
MAMGLVVDRRVTGLHTIHTMRTAAVVWAVRRVGTADRGIARVAFGLTQRWSWPTIRS